MERHRIKGLLKETIGLEARSLGQSRLDRAVEHRMAVLNLADIRGYVKLLHESQGELEALIEEIVVPETWFFRDKEPFDALTQHIMANWGKKCQKKHLRLLSVPCSTGEEPYSMAMALMNCDFPRDRFSIDAVDISSRAIEFARNACYKDYAFREKGLSIKKMFFTETDQGYVVNEAVREKVHFIRDNILHPQYVTGMGVYDVIFCRNLLIYLDHEAAGKLITIIDRLLAKEGILFVGHAETGRIPPEKFVPALYPRSFSFLRGGNARVKQGSYRPVKKAVNISSILDPSPGAASFIKTIRKKHKPEAVQKLTEASIPRKADLEEARRLADQGNLSEAASVCRAYLQEQGPSSTAYFLLGVVLDATGDPHRAYDALQKAVYLQPDHYEALLLLSLLAERTGDLARAERFKERAMHALDRRRYREKIT